MKYETKVIAGAKLRLYILSNCTEIDPLRRRPLIIICPGGGYHYCSEREAEPVAIRFLSMGYNTAILYYSVKDVEGLSEETLYPNPEQQLAQSVAYIRDHAEELNTNPDKICTMGFSAGAHLSASLGCFWQKYGAASRPNAQVVCYPVISSGEYGHRGSFENLCNNNQELAEQLSLEKHVNNQVPPTFIWHTKQDKTVNFMNSKLFEKALKENGVPVKAHYFRTGNHGLSLATTEVLSCKKPETNRNVAKWPLMVHKWLSKLFDTDFSK